MGEARFRAESLRRWVLFSGFGLRRRKVLFFSSPRGCGGEEALFSLSEFSDEELIFVDLLRRWVLQRRRSEPLRLGFCSWKQQTSRGSVMAEGRGQPPEWCRVRLFRRSPTVPVRWGVERVELGGAFWGPIYWPIFLSTLLSLWASLDLSG